MTITKEGTLASFYTVNKAPIKHLRVYFSPKQGGSGTASLENIRPIEGWNSVNLLHSGKNLVKNNNVNRTTNGVTFTINSDGSVHVQGTAAATLWWSYSGLPTTYIKAGTYKLTGGQPDAALYLVGIDDDGTNWSEARIGGTETGQGRTFTLSQGAQVRYQIVVVKGRTVDTIVYPMLTKVEETNGYENYNGIEQTINFPQTIYGGYVDLVTGEIVAEWAKYTCTGEEAITKWVLYGSSQNIAAKLPHSLCHANYIDGGKNAFCNIEDQVSNIQMYYSNTGHGVCISNNGFVTIQVDGITTLEAMSEWLTNNKPIIVYKLYTPVTYQLTLIQLQTLIGQNNIWSNADRVEVEYNLAESNDELYRRRNVILQGAPHLETATDSIVNFNTDMIAPIKDAKIYFKPIQEGEGDPSSENIRPINGYTSLSINQTGKNLINLSTASKQNNSSNIDTTIIDNTITITAKKASGSGVLLQQTIYWDIPPALRGKEVYFGVGSVNLNTNNENHRATIVCEFKDENNKFIVDPTVVSWINGGSNNTIARKYTIPQNAAKLEMYFRIAQNASTYGIIIGDSVTYNNFYIRYPTNTYGYEEYNGNIIPITFPAVGKNLLDITHTERINPGASTSNITIFNGVISIDAVASSARSYILFAQDFPAGTYTIQVQNSGAVGKPRLLTTSEISNSSYNTYYTLYSRQMSSDILTFTLTQTSKIGLVLSNLTNEAGNPGTIYNIQLESGSTATSYEPYTNTAYGGCVDLTNNKLVITHGFYKTTFGPSVASNVLGDTERHGYFLPMTFKQATDLHGDGQGPYKLKRTFCNIAPWSWDYYGDRVHYYIHENLAYIMLPVGTDPNTEIEFCAELATPIEYNLTSQQLKTLKGTNNIWSDANGSIEVMYWTH